MAMAFRGTSPLRKGYEKQNIVSASVATCMLLMTFVSVENFEEDLGFFFFFSITNIVR